MTDFTSEEKELAEWLEDEYIYYQLGIKKISHVNESWLLLARELLKKQKIYVELIRRRVQQRYNMCAHCRRQAVMVIDKYKSHFLHEDEVAGPPSFKGASVPTEDETGSLRHSKEGKRASASVGLSLCAHCGCMTKNKCGKCGGMK